jgi:hypothetical protein
MKKFLLVTVVIMPAFLFVIECGDASSRFLPPKIAQQKPILIKTDDPDLNGWTVPPGAHLIPKSYFVVLDDKPVNMLITAIGGGAAGVMIHHSLEAASQKKRLGDSEEIYQFDLKSLLDEVLAEEVIQNPNYELLGRDAKPPENSILLQNRVYLGTSKDNYARIHTIIEAKAPAQGKKKWWNRYIYYSNEWKPLIEPQSWAEGGQESIKAEVKHGIEQIMNFLFDDILQSPPKKTTLPQVTAKYMANSTPVTLKKVVVIKQTEDRVIVYITKPSEITSDGVHFLPDKETTVKSK